MAATEDADKKSTEPVQSCAREVSLDPALGTVGATQTKGSTISAASGVFWGRAQLAFVLVLPFALIAAWYYSGYITAWWVTRQHTAWLVDFYQKNAPEVSTSISLEKVVKMS